MAWSGSKCRGCVGKEWGRDVGYVGLCGLLTSGVSGLTDVWRAAVAETSGAAAVAGASVAAAFALALLWHGYVSAGLPGMFATAPGPGRLGCIVAAWTNAAMGWTGFAAA